MYALTNCDIYTGNDLVYDKAIIVAGSKIVDLVSYDDIPSGIDIKDLEGYSIAPGFIDVQVNGGGGVLFNDSPSQESIRRIVRAHNRFGTTDLLPTFITDDRVKMGMAINAVRESLNSNEPGILGIHLEGPFIAPSKAGVHDPNYIREPLDDDLDLLCSLRKGITLVTLAPERVPDDFIVQLVNNGVKVSSGHTAASFIDMKRAFELGVSGTTHLFNAMSPFTSREPGVLGASLEDKKSWCGVIADGYHVHFSSLKVAWQAKKKGKMLLVTDAMPPVGGDLKKFKLGSLQVEVTGGRCHTFDGVLAGSALDMATAVRNCVQHIGIPKDEALRMASTYPACFLGVEDSLGFIKPGYRANMTIFNNQIHVSAVIIEGNYRNVLETSSDN